MMADTFIEQPGDREVLCLKCPKCGHVHTRRRDSTAIGLHWLICKAFCGFESDKIKLLDGGVAEKGAAARRGGG